MILHFLLREKVYCPFFTRADLLIREMAEYCTESKVELDIIGPGKIIKLNLERELVLLKKALILLILSFVFLGTLVGIGAADTKAEIPPIGGTWDLLGTGTVDECQVKDTGTCTLISHIDSDGYEVVTRVFYEGEIREASGDIVYKSAYSFDPNSGKGVRIDSNPVQFTELDQNDILLNIESSTKATAKVTMGNALEDITDYVFSRDAAPVPVTPPSSLPRIAGTWNSKGKGTWGIRAEQEVTDSGTVVITASTGTDGYEVLTGYSAKGEIKNASGEVLTTYDYSLTSEDFGGELKISTRDFPIVFKDNRITIYIDSGTRLTAGRVGEVEYDSVKPLAETSDVITELMDAEYVLTREAPQPASGSSGCNAAGAVPLAVLLLPLLLLFRKP